MKELAGLLNHKMENLNDNIDSIHVNKMQRKKKKDYDFYMNAFSETKLPPITPDGAS